jgi:competence protein ComEC
MKVARVALVVALGVIAGVWIRFPGGPVCWLAALIVIMPLAWWLGGQCMAFFLLALGIANLSGHWYQQTFPHTALVGKSWLAKGCINTFPHSTAQGSSFGFVLLNKRATLGVPAKIFLRSYDPSFVARAGDCWQLMLRVRRASGHSNPGGTDRALWLYRERYTATGYVRASPLNKPLATVCCDHSLLRLRASIASKLFQAMPDGPAAGVINGITVGVRVGITPSVWSLFRGTGTSHLLAISGLHIALIASFLWWAGRALLRFMPALSRRFSYEHCGGYLAILGALGYAALAGFAIPTVRAAGLVVCAVLLRVHCRSSPALQVLSFMLICTLLVAPRAILAPGLWLSYFAVFVLVRSAGPDANTRIGLIRGIRRLMYLLSVGIRTQFFLWVSLSLPTIFMFGQYSLVAPFANLLLTPLFVFIVLPLALLGTVAVIIAPKAGELILAQTVRLLELTLEGLALLAQPDWSVWYPSMPGLGAIALIAVGLALLLAPAPVRQVFLGSLLVAIGLLWQPAPNTASVRVTVYDVGQGTAALIRTARHVVLIDTGPRWPGGDAGRQTIVPALRAIGVNHLDAVIISHGDADHSGGLAAVLDDIGTDIVLGPPALDYPGTSAVCRRGMKWTWDGVEFVVLHPAKHAGWSDNNASCVIAVRAENETLLFPGDIEFTAEQVLAAREKLSNTSAVLVPHHGSKSSSSERFAAATSPRYAIYTTGEGNRWGFPRAVVQKRWRASGACELNTAYTGAIELVVKDGEGVQLTSLHRYRWRRPWAVRPVTRAPCGYRAGL